MPATKSRTAGARLSPPCPAGARKGECPLVWALSALTTCRMLQIGRPAATFTQLASRNTRWRRSRLEDPLLCTGSSNRKQLSQ